MAEAIISSTHTFQVLFVNGDGIPVDVGNPRITVFRYATGVKETLVNNQPMVASTPAETGRYVYSYVVPSTFHDGDTIYGEMSGDDLANPGDVLRHDEEVSIIAATRAGGGYSGLTAQFVKGG